MSQAIKDYAVNCRACGEPIRGERDVTIHWKCNTHDVGRLTQAAIEELETATITLRRIYFTSGKGQQISKDSRKLAIEINKWLKRWRDQEKV